MQEIIQSLSAGYLWIILFIAFAIVINRATGQVYYNSRGFVFAYPLFSFFQICSAKFLDFTDQLHAAGVLYVHLGALIVLAAIFLILWSKISAAAPLRSDSMEIRFVAITGLTVTGLLLIALGVISFVIPVNFRDDHIYHMPMVANYVQNHSLQPWATQDLRQILRPNAIELQMLHLALLSNSDSWLELPNLLALFVALAATFQIARITLGSRTLAWISVLAVLTARQILLSPTTVSNDAPFMAFTLCSFYGVLGLAGSAPKRMPLWIGFLLLSTGMAVATKVVGPWLAVTVLMTLSLMAITGKLPAKAWLGFVIALVVAVAIVLGDVIMDNIAHGGHFLGLSKKEYGRIVFFPWEKIVWFYLYELSYYRLFNPPNLNYGTAHYGFLFPITLILGLIASLRHTWLFFKSKQAYLPILAMMTIIFFLCILGFRVPRPHDQRFMTWLVPCLAILTLSLLPKQNKRILIFLTASLGIYALTDWSIVWANSSLGMMLRNGIWQIASHQHVPRYVDYFRHGSMLTVSGKKLDYLAGYNTLEEMADSNDSVLVIGGKDSWIYPAWGSRFSRKIEGVSDHADSLRKIRSHTYNFVVVERSANANIRQSAHGELRQSPYSPMARNRRRSVYQLIISQ